MNKQEIIEHLTEEMTLANEDASYALEKLSANFTMNFRWVKVAYINTKLSQECSAVIDVVKNVDDIHKELSELEEAYVKDVLACQPEGDVLDVCADHWTADAYRGMIRILDYIKAN